MVCIRHSYFWRVGFYLACGVVLVLSLMPTNQLPALFSLWDKVQHALGFAGLTMIGFFAYRFSFHRVGVGLILFGGGIEWAQSLTTWRTGDGLDWLADSVGIAIVYMAINILTSKKKS